MTLTKTLKRAGSKTYKNSGVEFIRHDCQGLRFQTVKSGGVVDNNLIIDQHGRIFTNDRDMSFIACGSANH